MLVCAAPAKPFFLEDGIQILVSPFALKPDVLQKMPFAAHSQSLEEGDRRGILTIGDCDDAMEIQCQIGSAPQTGATGHLDI
jgi:hypothetical protein